MPFTQEELEEMARFDASLEADFQLTEKEVAFSTNMDHVAITESLFGTKLRQRQYYEANKEKRAEYQRQHYQANKEKRAEYQQQYYAKKKAEKETIIGLLDNLGLRIQEMKLWAMKNMS